ncbi:MAG: sugar phosphate nucleotidyltransferase [Chloroflexota bacterium]|nr:NTP transferase domain-containing protein [Chloroflexota bacterium]
MIETAAILAGGLATRLKPITEKIPKSLVEVAGRPFIEWQLKLLQAKGLRRVVLCLGHLGSQIEEVVGDGTQWGLEVEYSHDGPHQLGTAGALLQARSRLGEQFWVLYGDSYLNFDYRAVSDYFELAAPDQLGLMTVFANHNLWDTSNVVFEDGRLLKYDKWQRVPEMHYIDYGAALLRTEALELLVTLIQERPSDLANLYSHLVEEQLMLGYEVTERFYEIGSPAGLRETDLYFRDF